MPTKQCILQNAFYNNKKKIKLHQRGLQRRSDLWSINLVICQVSKTSYLKCTYGRLRPQRYVVNSNPPNDRSPRLNILHTEEQSEKRIELFMTSSLDWASTICFQGNNLLTTKWQSEFRKVEKDWQHKRTLWKNKDTSN